MSGMWSFSRVAGASPQNAVRDDTILREALPLAFLTHGGYCGEVEGDCGGVLANAGSHVTDDTAGWSSETFASCLLGEPHIRAPPAATSAETYGCDADTTIPADVDDDSIHRSWLASLCTRYDASADDLATDGTSATVESALLASSETGGQLYGLLATTSTGGRSAAASLADHHWQCNDADEIDFFAKLSAAAGDVAEARRAGHARSVVAESMRDPHLRAARATVASAVAAPGRRPTTAARPPLATRSRASTAMAANDNASTARTSSQRLSDERLAAAVTQRIAHEGRVAHEELERRKCFETITNVQRVLLQQQHKQKQQPQHPRRSGAGGSCSPSTSLLSSTPTPNFSHGQSGSSDSFSQQQRWLYNALASPASSSSETPTNQSVDQSQPAMPNSPLAKLEADRTTTVHAPSVLPSSESVRRHRDPWSRLHHSLTEKQKMVAAILADKEGRIVFDPRKLKEERLAAFRRKMETERHNRDAAVQEFARLQTIKIYGWQPWRRLVRSRRWALSQASEHWRCQLLRRSLRQWQQSVSTWRRVHRAAFVARCARLLRVLVRCWKRHCFGRWKSIMIVHRAQRHAADRFAKRRTWRMWQRGLAIRVLSRVASLEACGDKEAILLQRRQRHRLFRRWRDRAEAQMLQRERLAFRSVLQEVERGCILQRSASESRSAVVALSPLLPDTNTPSFLKL